MGYKNYRIKGSITRYLQVMLWVSWLVISGHPALSQPIFEETFSNWTENPSCPVGWSCSTYENCNRGLSCYWNRNDKFPQLGSPSTTGCDTSTYYARCNTVNLPLGQSVRIISPILDLSQTKPSDSVLLSFCFINSSTQAFDNDALRLLVSSNGGTTWSQLSNITKVSNGWTLESFLIPTAFRSNRFRFRFDGQGGNALGDIGIDDVTVRNISIECKTKTSSIAYAEPVTAVNCRDLSTVSTISLRNTGPFLPGVEYAYLVTDLSDTLISVIYANSFDRNLFPGNFYKIYGAFYIDTLQAQIGMTLATIRSLPCVKLSNNFLSFTQIEINGTVSPIGKFGASVSCFGASDAALSAGATGGTAPYSFTWNTGSTSPSINSLSAGLYRVEIKDTNGCLDTVSASISNPGILTANIQLTSPITCAGEFNGALTLVPTGGTSPYTYLWGNRSITDKIQSLGRGRYIGTITDANGCTASDTFDLKSPEPLLVQALVISNFNGKDVSSPTARDGVAQAVASGGTGKYTYFWNTNPAQLSETATGLGVGTYEVTVLDANGCRQSAQVIIRNPESFTASIRVVSNYNGQAISCKGAKDGVISVSTLGANGDLFYRWENNPAATPTLENLGAGTYSVRIVDASGQEVSASITLNEPDSLTILPNIKDPSCLDLNDGSILLSVSGGTAPYTYAWSQGSTENAVVGLAKGKYSVIVKDANNCSVADSFNLQEGSSLIATFSLTDESCPGGEDGAIITNIERGIAPYSFKWSNGAITQDLLNVSAGLYAVTIDDGNNCSLTRQFEIKSIDSLEIAANILSDNGTGTGSIEVLVIGGLDPYTYSWNVPVPDTSSKIEGLKAGTYFLTVKDVNGCTALDTFIVDEEANACPALHTGFTPNGDGINDTWVIPCLRRLGKNVVFIFNRQGQKVYEKADYQNDWRGDYDGRELPSGAYFYLIQQLGQSRNRIYKGTVNIIR